MSLSPKDLKKLSEKPAHLISKGELHLLLEYFSPEVDFAFSLFKLFLKKRKELLEAGLLKSFARKLKLEEKEAEELLKEEPIEVYFPVSDGKKALLNRLLVVPLRGKVRGFGPFDEGKLLQIKELTGRGFFVLAESPDFRGSSYTLALYAALSLGKKSKAFAFTGLVNEDGTLEEAEHLPQKLDVCEKAQLPLVFAKKGALESTEDLKEFFGGIKVPLSLLFDGKKAELFDGKFKFGAGYLERVFHLKEKLHYTEALKDNAESFGKLREWLKNLLHEMKSKIPKGFEWHFAVAQKVVAVSFLTGVETSLERLKAEFYNYSGEKYERLYAIEDDTFPPKVEPVERWFEVREPKGLRRLLNLLFIGRPFEEVVIKTKSGAEERWKALQLVAKEHKVPENLFKSVSISLADFLRRRCKGDRPYTLEMELPVGIAFALGYYLENFIPLKVKHKGKKVFEIKKW